MIRTEQVGDAEAIRAVLLAAFDGDAEANLVDALRDAGIELISLVAEEEGEVVGQILFSPVTGLGDRGVMGLAPMAVIPRWQRRGVGGQLIEAGLKACALAQYEAIVVLGHPGYYPRFGFEPSVKYGVRSEYEVPPEVFMVKEMREGALMGVTGTVRYHPAFGAL